MITNKKAFPQKPKGYIYLAGKKVKIGSSKKVGKNSRENTIRAIQEMNYPAASSGELDPKRN